MNIFSTGHSQDNKANSPIAISVESLVKTFQVPLVIKESYSNKIKHYFYPKSKNIIAVNGISFHVKYGERVAFIGPNGAGKSTTLKILTGILRPTFGHVKVLNQIPSEHRRTLAYQIGAIFGQRSQLWFHLPVQETFKLLAAIYDLPKNVYLKRLKDLSDQFDINKLLTKPVRQLSLGERMRCEIVASLLHKPSVLFLDEPTIGLDIVAKSNIRDLMRAQSEQEGATLLLTSHDADDIEKVCDRVIIVDQGKILLDDTLSNLKTRYIQKKVLTIALEEENATWQKEGTKILEKSQHHIKIEVDLNKHVIESIVAEFIEKYTIKDLTIEGPPLETIIFNLYNEKRTDAHE